MTRRLRWPSACCPCTRDFATGHFVLGLAEIGAGRLSDALEALKRASPLDDSPEVVAHTGLVYALMGRRAEAERTVVTLKERAPQRYVSPASIGLIYAALGDRDAAFEWLDRGYDDRSWWMISQGRSPVRWPAR